LKPVIEVHDVIVFHLDNLNKLIDEVMQRNDWVFTHD
jgi:hypothetical protein